MLQQNSPFLKCTLHIICCKLLVVLFLTQNAQKTSQWDILWICLRAKEKRDLPRFVWPTETWSTTELLYVGKGLYRDHTEDSHHFSQTAVLFWVVTCGKECIWPVQRGNKALGNTSCEHFWCKQGGLCLVSNQFSSGHVHLQWTHVV